MVKNMNEEGILETLYWYVEETHPISNSKTKDCFTKLRKTMDQMGSNEADKVFAVVSDLCIERGKIAFAEGVRIGITLMQEIKR